MLLDFRMQTFLTVCKYMNYTKAASVLHITQPAVTQHIQYLEQAYACKLFEKDGKRMQLSLAGEVLLQTATTYHNDEQHLKDKILAAQQITPPLTFGATMTIGEYVLGEPLSHYCCKHPDTNITVIMANTSELLTKILDGEISFALVEGYYPTESFDSYLFSKEEFIPVCSASHVFKKEPQSLRDLIHERILIRESGSGTRDIFEKSLDAQNMSLKDFHHFVELNSMPALITMIKNDCGISFLYKRAVQKELSEGILKELSLEDFHMQHDFTFIWNKNSIYIHDFMSICKELQQTY